jgi:hypothetical protein
LYETGAEEWLLLLPPQPTANIDAPKTSRVKMIDALLRFPGIMNVIPTNPRQEKGWVM